LTLKKLGCLCLSALFLTTPAFAAETHISPSRTYDNRFTDLPLGSWYKPYAISAYTYELMQGTDAKHFSPSGVMSRAEAAAVAVRLYARSYSAELDESTKTEPWYQVYSDYAQAYHILPADFSVDTSPISRKDFAYMINAALTDSDKKPKNDVPEGSIPDVDPDAYYHDAAYQLYQAGILTGSDDQNTFNPDRTLTRAETAAILSRAAVPSLRVTPTDTPETPGLPVAKPGLRTLRNLLATAMQPVGRTMYVWGGGWNEADTGAGEDAVTIGVSPQWEAFFQKQTASYDYNRTRHQIHNGLDCTGYLGWVVYNTLQNQDGLPGYVVRSSKMAENYARHGWGTYTPNGKVTDFQAGDVISMPGHVWLSLGTCEDGSVLFVHASPPGVSLCGTTTAGGKETQATRLAQTYMQRYFPAWCEKYQSFQKGTDYLTQASQMRWNAATMPDPDGYLQLTPEELLQHLFGEVS
jgi:hypothetical protein